MDELRRVLRALPPGKVVGVGTIAAKLGGDDAAAERAVLDALEAEPGLGYYDAFEAEFTRAPAAASDPAPVEGSGDGIDWNALLAGAIQEVDEEFIVVDDMPTIVAPPDAAARLKQAVKATFYWPIFIVLAVIDVFSIAIAWKIPYMYLPLVVHAVFMPILIFLAYNQKKGTLEPEKILVFFKSMVLYMIVHMAVKIAVAVFIFDILFIFFNLLLGGFMISIWWRIIKLLKKLIIQYPPPAS